MLDNTRCRLFKENNKMKTKIKQVLAGVIALVAAMVMSSSASGGVAAQKFDEEGFLHLPL